MTTVALLLAAGSGARLGRGGPKAFIELGGRPMLVHPLEAMAASGVIDDVVLLVPRSHVARARELARHAPVPVRAVIAGGATREASVRAGLAALVAGDDVTVCHDAARPLASPELYRRVVEAVRERRRPPDGAPLVAGVIPVVRVADTVKRVRGESVLETVPRDELALAQTPQAFDTEALRRAHERAVVGVSSTDDSMLLERAGEVVVVVDGETANLKVTTEDDLALAEQLLAGRPVVEPARTSS